jgi:hypothetical protein
MKKLPILTKVAICAIGIAIAFLLPFGCTQPTEAERVLRQSGYTQIEITGWRPFAAGEDDTYSTGFKARSPSGETVTGAVTAGILKGSTIRLD